MTISTTRQDSPRRDINLANGMLRHRFGYTPKSRNLPRTVVLRQGGDAETVRRRQWSSANATRAADDFRLDTAHPARSSTWRSRVSGRQLR